MNKLFLTGRLGRDAELKYTQAGTAVANFTLATEKKWKKNDQKQSKTIWHSVNLWGKTAESLSQYLRKGRKVTIVGELDEQKWEDKQGNKRSKSVVICQEIDIHFEKEVKNPPNWQDTDENYNKEENNFANNDIPF